MKKTFTLTLLLSIVLSAVALAGGGQCPFSQGTSAKGSQNTAMSPEQQQNTANADNPAPAEQTE